VRTPALGNERSGGHAFKGRTPQVPSSFSRLGLHTGAGDRQHPLTTKPRRVPHLRGGRAARPKRPATFGCTWPAHGPAAAPALLLPPQRPHPPEGDGDLRPCDKRLPLRLSAGCTSTSRLAGDADFWSFVAVGCALPRRSAEPRCFPNLTVEGKSRHSPKCAILAMSAFLTPQSSCDLSALSTPWGMGERQISAGALQLRSRAGHRGWLRPWVAGVCPQSRFPPVALL
jgi:hypothetical protein